MNKTAIKNFAIWARRKLIADITYKAGMVGVSENGIAQPLPQSTRDLQFFDIGTKNYAEVSGAAIEQRNALVKVIRAKEHGSDYKTAFQNVIEEVAYTWFNRLIAVRFMEVNDYLPSKIRVLSSESEGKLEPDFVTTPFETDLEFSAYERDRILQLKDNNKLDELFRFLFIKQCNKLSEILPGLFEKISDYTELLLNISFTDKDGIIYHLTHDISEDEFNVEKEGQVEIIGWMYQYYNTEPKDEVFALLKKNVKITKERIPAATQLFTPDWIVRYMVENTLGRLWVEGHPNEDLKKDWKYYLEEAKQELDVVAQLKKIREEYTQLNPTDIKVIDPCMGSGHILVYAFDVLMQIYKSQGYVERDAAKSILVNNLYGIDIDTRAYQLAYFAVMMKARQYNRKIFQENITPNLIAIRNPEDVPKSVLKRLGALEPVGLRILEDFEDAEEYGSILQVSYTEDELDWVERKLAEIEREAQYGNLLVQMESAECVRLLKPLVKQARLLAQKYEVVVTNPPYMGAIGMSDILSKFVKNHYADSKSDLFSVFVERSRIFAKDNCYYALITQPSILFLSSFEKLRREIIEKQIISSLLHMGRGIFGIDFGSTAFVLSNTHLEKYIGRYFRLHARTFQYINPDDIRDLFLNTAQNTSYKYDFSMYDTKTYNKNAGFDVDVEDETVMDGTFTGEQRLHYYSCQDFYTILPGAPFAYWASQAVYNSFSTGITIKDVAYPCEGIKTGDNDRFLRLWYEINILQSAVLQSRDSKTKWIKHAKGGPYRRWYGNLEYVINWFNNGYEIRHSKKATISNETHFFTDAITWSYISAGKISTRCVGTDILYNNKGPACYCSKELLLYLLGLSNSVVFNHILQFWAATMDFKPGNIAAFPFVDQQNKVQINNLVQVCIDISKNDWDAYETSWDYKAHPLVYILLSGCGTKIFNSKGELGDVPCTRWRLADCFDIWHDECQKRFDQLKANEEELNRIFIEIYGLQDELTPDVAEKDITVRKADLERDIRSLISYAVGCIFGRYSLDAPGLAYAGGEWDTSKYSTFVPDADNCIPITDTEYFQDDIVGRFVEFIRTVYGEDTLEENLQFVAAALGNKGNTSREVIRNYFLNDFYKDHLKVYQKRPIYWLFDSGKQNGFKALVYMHRWNADTVGNVRVEYLHKMQTVYERELESCQDMIDHGNGHEIATATRRKEKLIKQMKECKDYDALVAHIALSRIDIDLDDGVKVNYRKVQTGADGKFCEILADSKDIMAKEK